VHPRLTVWHSGMPEHAYYSYLLAASSLFFKMVILGFVALNYSTCWCMSTVKQAGRFQPSSEEYTVCFF